jgi:hypothetical protein
VFTVHRTELHASTNRTAESTQNHRTSISVFGPRWASRLGCLSRIAENGIIPDENGIPQIRTDKRSTVFGPAPGSVRPVFGPVSVYPAKKRKRTGKYGIRLRTERDSSRPFSSLLTTASAPVLHVSGLPATTLRGPAPVAHSQAQRERNKIVYSFRHQ